MARRRIVDAASVECDEPPPPRVLRAAAAALGGANRYPSPRLAARAVEAASAYYGVDPECLVPLPGSDTALELLSRALRLRRIAAPWPGFYAYSRIPASLGLAVDWLPVEPGVEPALDPGRLASALAASGAVVADNPNNPLGTLAFTWREAREALARAPWGVLVSDEAYREFSGHSLARRACEAPGLVVLHTLSKAFALAGLRVGFLVAHPTLAARLRAADPLPYRLSAPALAAAAAALEDPGYAAECAARLNEARARLAARLRRLGYRVHEGRAPVLAVETGAPDAPRILERLGIRVAPLDWWKPGAVRVTPVPRHLDEIAAAFEELAAHPSA